MISIIILFILSRPFLAAYYPNVPDHNNIGMTSNMRGEGILPDGIKIINQLLPVAYCLLPYSNVIVNCSTKNLEGSWIWLDTKNTTEQIPGLLFINKPGMHNITLIKNNITITQDIQVNESLAEVLIGFKNDTITTTLTYDLNED